MPGVGWEEYPLFRLELARYKPDKADHPHRRGADDQVEVRRAQGDTLGMETQKGNDPFPPEDERIPANGCGR